ncbi:MAG TPA: HEAT repeat domain-containing protein, partial [Planctomycetota bacterium]|nr:HEAT repeat domain-containing protein [Planctomycetota bacterium]
MLVALAPIVLARFAAARGAEAGGQIPSVFAEDLERYSIEARSLDPLARLGAARGLASMAHRDGVASLIDLLGDTDALVRREAALGLGRTGGPLAAR